MKINGKIIKLNQKRKHYDMLGLGTPLISIKSVTIEGK